MKKLLRYSLLFMFLLWLFRGWLFRLTVNYHSFKELTPIAATDTAMLRMMEGQPIDTAIQRIIKRSLDLTAQQLRFSFDQCDSDPNRLFYSHKANCVGYAAYFNTVCEKLLRQSGQEKRYKVRHLRANIRFLGIDLHQLTDRPFFKDHDYNAVEDVLTGERLFVDASTKDVLGIGYVESR